MQLETKAKEHQTDVLSSLKRGEVRRAVGGEDLAEDTPEEEFLEEGEVRGERRGPVPEPNEGVKLPG